MKLNLICMQMQYVLGQRGVICGNVPDAKAQSAPWNAFRVVRQRLMQIIHSSGVHRLSQKPTAACCVPPK